MAECTNDYTSVSISGYNSAPPPDDGTTGTSNLLTWKKHKEKLGDPIKTALEAMDSNIDSAIDSIVACINAYHNDVGFGAYAGSATSLTQNTWTKVEFDTEEFDLGNDFASHSFTAPAAGKYLFCAAVSIGTLADANPADMAFYKNGSIIKQFNNSNASTNTSEQAAAGACILDLSAADTVSIYARVETTGDEAKSGQSVTWFQGWRVA